MLDPPHDFQLDLIEFQRHEAAFLDADAVFAGECAVQRQNQLEDFPQAGLGLFHLFRIVRGHWQIYMDIAIAGLIEVDVGDAVELGDIPGRNSA